MTDNSINEGTVFGDVVILPHQPAEEWIPLFTSAEVIISPSTMNSGTISGDVVFNDRSPVYISK
jgi:hypothetical protein